MTISFRVPLIGESHDTTGKGSLPERVVELRSVTGDRLHIELFEMPPAWLWRMFEHVKELLSLPRGWNSYAAAPVTLAAATALLETVRDAMSDRTPFPHISPLSSGGIQVEWHERDLDIEVAIDEGGHSSMWFEDARTGRAGELPLDRSDDRLRGLLVELADRA